MPFTLHPHSHCSPSQPFGASAGEAKCSLALIALTVSVAARVEYRLSYLLPYIHMQQIHRLAKAALSLNDRKKKRYSFWMDPSTKS